MDFTLADIPTVTVYVCSRCVTRNYDEEKMITHVLDKERCDAQFYLIRSEKG